MTALAATSGSFVREQLRAPLTLALLVAVPAFFVLIFAGVLGTFAEALGGTLASRSATAISAGWAAAFLSGALGFFQVSSSRGADRRLASAGLGAFRVAVARISASLLLAATVSAVAFATLWLRSGIGHPLHAAVAIFAFAAIYIGIGALVGAFLTGALEGSLLVLLVWSLDAFSGPQMTSSGRGALTPTRDAANLLIAAGAGAGLSGSRLARRPSRHRRRAGRRAGRLLVHRADEERVMVWRRTATATAMAFRDQLRRPLVPILLVVVPAFIVIWSVAITQPESRRIELAGGVWVTTTMKALHGPEMAKFTVAFVAALIGVFVMRAALQGDRRLVVAGLRAREVVAARLVVLLTATTVAVVVAAAAIALNFSPASWLAVVGALLLTGLIYAGLGSLVGVLLDKLAATYLILFVVAADLSVVQTPMFHASPSRFAPLLPGYGPTRVMLEGAFAPSFKAGLPLLIALAWAVALNLAAHFVLRRALGTDEPVPVNGYAIPRTGIQKESQ